MPSAYDALSARLAEIADVNYATSILNWDIETYMPSAAISTRGEHIATLSRLSHQMQTAPDTRTLVEGARSEVGEDPDDDRAALVSIANYDINRAIRIPNAFVAERARAQAKAHADWIAARKAADFNLFRDSLVTMFDFARRTADFLGYDEHPYDALLGTFERGMKTSDITAVFSDLRAKTVPLVRAIAARGDLVSDACVRQRFPKEDQLAFCARVASAFGYDFTRGRIDLSAHPFCVNFTRNDVRMTTRVSEDFLNPCLFGVMHETGHALFEQGTAPNYVRSPLGRGASLGVHESQSRLWENIVGRSLWFWRTWYPGLQAAFPVLNDTPLESFYRAINKVAPTLIRVEADEVTYNLHIMVRFEIETGVLEGKLRVDEMPELWNARMKEYLGVSPPNDALGCLQDIHWSAGLIGYFPTYSLGNILSAQLFAAARAGTPGLEAALAGGDYSGLLGWMRTNIHQHGRKYPPAELIRRATGNAMSADAYVAYLTEKFGAIYGI